MSAASIPKLLTVEEYEQLPDRPGGHWELHHGEAVFVTFLRAQHKLLWRRIRKLLERVCEPLGYVDRCPSTRYGAQTSLWSAIDVMIGSVTGWTDHRNWSSK